MIKVMEGRVDDNCWLGCLQISLSEVSIKICHSQENEGFKGRVRVKVKVQTEFTRIRRLRHLLREDDTRRPNLYSSM